MGNTISFIRARLNWNKPRNMCAHRQPTVLAVGILLWWCYGCCLPRGLDSKRLWVADPIRKPFSVPVGTFAFVRTLGNKPPQGGLRLARMPRVHALQGRAWERRSCFAGGRSGAAPAPLLKAQPLFPALALKTSAPRTVPLCASTFHKMHGTCGKGLETVFAPELLGALKRNAHALYPSFFKARRPCSRLRRCSRYVG